MSMVTVKLSPAKRRFHLGRTLSDSALTLLTYFLAFLFFFPIFWMFLTGFKTEVQAFTSPPVLFFQPVLENYQKALVNYAPAFFNSIMAALGSTILAFLLGLPAAYSLALYPTKRARSTLLWIVSTKMMPPVGVIVPLFLIFKTPLFGIRLLDSVPGLILMYTTMNLPLVIWMMHSYLVEIPYEVLEAGRVDGANIWQEFFHIALPLATPGMASTALLCIIFAWNEVFFALNLTTVQATPLSMFITSFKTSQGLFWAQMSAAATLTVAPVLIFGWLAQRQLVRGLTLGAIK
jgi:sorbitol/mannitol transport system permease protein